MLKPSVEVAEDPSVSFENGYSTVNSFLKKAMVESTVAIEEKSSEAAEEEAVVEENDSSSALSGVNSESREEMVDLVVAENEEDLVLAFGVGGIKQARPNGGGNRKSKGSSSYNMRTRNAKSREIAELEAAKVMKIGSALGLDFQRLMRRCWKKLLEGKRKMWLIMKLCLLSKGIIQSLDNYVDDVASMC
ncbi:hypothetical protein Q3G72_031926 [Acer saccharum]|nr:hypothetical protein Q3G72_031926 [Acer saccharum]